MLQVKKAFSGFSVNDLAKAKTFYTETLGLSIADSGMGLQISLPGNGVVFIYSKPNHQAATFTILNFEVENINEAVDALIHKGVVFEHYEEMQQDEKGIMRGIAAHRGPDIAWFKDPAGNILSILQNS